MWSKIIEFITKILTQVPPPNPPSAPGAPAPEVPPRIVPPTPMPITPKPVVTPLVITDFGYKVGDLARKYETSDEGPGYISNGASWGDPGGDSYGSYQLETKLGTMQAYLKIKDKFTDALNNALPVNSAQFKSTWKKLAEEDPNEFEQSQFNYLARKPNGFYEALNYARGLNWNVDNLAMQSAIFSTSNQSGGWKNGIFSRTGIKFADSLEDQINKLYDARAAYFRGLNLSPTIKMSIIKSRTMDERKDCLKLVVTN